MTKPKITNDQAQKLLEVVRYALDNHEWCERPSYRDTRCGGFHYHPNECEDVEVEFVNTENAWNKIPCEGCKARAKGEVAAKWKRGL